MSSEWLSHRRDDALIFGQQLAHEFQTNAPAGSQDEPCGKVLIGI
jgi:hypothetical protein